MSLSNTNYAGVAATWTINQAKPAPPAERVFTTDNTQESVFDPDYRSLVDDNDIKDGGKYRSIVKLQMRYEGQQEDDHAYSMGTGWLISPDTLVTAGHNVFDWSGYGTGLGRAVHIKAYIGYHGRENVNSPIVQSRVAKEVVTTAEWIMSRENRHRDVAIIRLDRPFEGNLRCFTYKATPKQGDEMIGVVGYPADKVHTYDDGREEKGALMYEQFNDVAYSLEPTKFNTQGMLKYRISTFGGQSGAPIIRKSAKQTAIGVHVYGGGDKNQASVIGPLGNDLDSLLKVFTGQLPVVQDYQGIKLVRHVASNGLPAGAFASKAPSFNSGGFHPVNNTPAASDVRQRGNNPPNFGIPTFSNSNQSGYQPNAGSRDAESFFTDLTDAGKWVGGTLAKTLLQQPFFKNAKAGGPLAAAAGAALNALVNTAESASSDPAAATRGAAERAALAEAALQTVLKLDSESAVTMKVLTDMKNSYLRFAPVDFKPIACHLAPALLRSANDILSNPDDFISRETTRLPAVPILGVNAESASENSNPFLAKLLVTPVRPVATQGNEGAQAEAFGISISSLGNVFNKGLKVATPWLRDAATAGGQKLLDFAIGKFLGKAESATDAQLSEADVQAAELVVKRAVLGEAALQAISNLNNRELQEATLMPTRDDDIHEEGWGLGDLFSGITQTILPTVLKVTPVVAGMINPLAGFAAQAATGVIGGIAGINTESAADNGLLGAPRSGLQKKRSIIDLLNDGLLHNQAPAVGMQEMERQALAGTLPRLEYLRMRALVDGPDPNDDKLVFVTDD